MKLSRWLTLGGTLVGGYWLLQRLQPQAAPLILKDSVVLITGASAGIGRAYAHAFAKRGAHVVLAARRADMLGTVGQEISQYGGEALIVPTDVSDLRQLEALVAATLERFGRIDVLVNNAGVTASGPVHTLSIDRLRHAIDVNLAAAICLTNLVLPFMLARGAGRIVNVSSGLGAVAMPFFSAYSASKHGLIAFSDALRRETEGTGIGVTSVLPGWTQSEMVPLPLEQRLRKMGFTVDTAEYVADRTVEGLLDGKSQIIFGGLNAYLGIWLERYCPLLITLYWRTALTPEFIALSRGETQ